MRVDFSYYLLSVFFFCTVLGFSEGTKEIRPSATDSGALYIGSHNSGYSNFGRDGINDAEYRLFIKTQYAGEKILFGLTRTPGSNPANFKLHDRNGAIVLTGLIPGVGSPGFIPNYTQAVAGPFAGGYTPLSYTVPSIADTGSYYLDFDSDTDILYFDITVVNNTASIPPVPADAVPGRVYSKSWQFYCGTFQQNYNKFNGKVFVYSDDGIVTRLDFKNMVPGAFTIYCNPTGCTNTTNPYADRKSRTGNNAYPQFKVFINNPDNSGPNQTPFPDGQYGIMTQPPQLIPAAPPCSGNATIKVWVNKAGKVQILLDFPDPYVDKEITSIVGNGENSIPWNGLDKVGIPIPDGTQILINVKYINGLTNLPMYDIEYNNFGFNVTLIRPVGGSITTPLIYWDDSQITACNIVNKDTVGCDPSINQCHQWSLNCGDGNTINTWWYSASTSNMSITPFHVALPPVPFASIKYRCDPGIINLEATVLQQEQVRWYDQPTGGTLLFTGSPYVVNLPANGVYHFYAEAYNPTSTCTSATRTDVVAKAVPFPAAPTPLGAPFFTCGAGTVTLVSTNTNPGIRVDWYDGATPPTKVGFGNFFTTPVISATTTYYAEAVEIESPAGCTSTTRTPFAAEVRPVPVISNTTIAENICSGGSPTIVVGSTLDQTTFSWTAINPDGRVNNFSATGTGGLTSEILNINTGIFQPGLVIYAVTPARASCVGNATNFNINVNPYPDLTISPASTTTICSGAQTNIALSSQVSGTTYTWNASGYSGNILPVSPVSGTSNPIAQSFSNSGNTVEPVTFSIIPSAVGCASAATPFTIQVNPVPGVTLPFPSQTVCSGAPDSPVLLNTTVVGTPVGYSWTTLCDAGITNCPGGGSAIQIPAASIINTAYIQQNVTYSVTAAIGTCSGPASNYVVHVNPIPDLVISPVTYPDICSGTATNITLSSHVALVDFNWTASGNPATITPVPPFSGNGSTIAQNLANSGNILEPVIFSITPAALGCAPAVTAYTVNVNPVPAVLLPNPASQTVCSNVATTAVTLNTNVTGTTVAYNWITSCDAGITGCPGGASAGTIPAASIINTAFVQQNATYAVTASIGTCPGPVANYVVHVNPIPDLVISPAIHPDICSGAATNIALSSHVALVDFNWTASGNAATITPVPPFSGNGSTIAQTLANSGNILEPVIFSITPTALGCAPAAMAYTVNVNPVPVVLLPIPASQTVCSNVATPAVSLNTNVTGTPVSYNWTTSCDAGITNCPGGGSAIQIPAASIINTAYVQQNVTYAVTATIGTCPGPASNYVVHVDPIPDLLISPVTHPDICSGAATNIALSSHVALVDFYWAASGNAATITPVPPFSGNGSTISQTLGNSGNIVEPVIFSITPSALGCAPPPAVYAVNVDPVPSVICAATQTICSGTYTQSTPLSSSVASGVSYTWSAVANPASLYGFAASGSGVASIPAEPVYNPEVTQGSVTYTITAHFGPCTGTTSTHVVLVNPSPTVTPSIISQAVCSMNQPSQQIDFFANVSPTTYVWTVDQVSGLNPGYLTGGITGFIPVQSLSVSGTVQGFVKYKIVPSSQIGMECPGAPNYATILVNPLPLTPVITGGTGPGAGHIECENQPGVSYSVPVVTGHTYTWTVSGGTISGSSTAAAVVVDRGPADPAASVAVTETDQNFPTACTASSAYTVNLTPRPVPVISSLNAAGICQGLTGNYYTTQTGMTGYTWTIPAEGTITDGGNGYSFVKIRWTTPGTKTIYLNFRNAYNCDGLPPGGSMTFTVYPLPDVTIAGTGTSPVCQDYPQSYPYATQTIDPTNIYNWSIPMGTGDISPGASANPIQVTWRSSGNAQLKVIATTTNGCVDATTIPITVYAKPAVSLSSCFDQTTILGAKPIRLKGGLPNGTNGVYYVDQPLLTPVTQFTPSTLGAHSIYFSFTNASGCIATSNPVTITVLDPSSVFTGCPGTLTDRRESPPATYRTIWIGSQCWMLDNLRYSRGGAAATISFTSPQTDNCSFERYCILPGDPTCSTYGGFYQWDELMQYDGTDRAQGFCPPGWHVPDESEWDSMISNVSNGIGNGIAGAFLTDTGATGLFQAKPAGIFYLNNIQSFTSLSPKVIFFWTSTLGSTSKNAVAKGLNSVAPSVSRYESSKANAFPVRCVKD